MGHMWSTHLSRDCFLCAARTFCQASPLGVRMGGGVGGIRMVCVGGGGGGEGLLTFPSSSV